MNVYDGIDKNTVISIIDSLVNIEGAERGITLSQEFLKSLLNALNGDEQNERIEWHPYPEEKPTKEGTYLVTKKYEEEVCIATSGFSIVFGSFCGGRFVTAWAELPKPYEDKKG